MYLEAKLDMYTRFFIGAAAVLAEAMWLIPAYSAEEQVISAGKVTYVSGGVGEDSAARLLSNRKNYNLRLLFAAKDGHYLAGVETTLTDNRGGKLLATVSDGPFLFLKVPPGKYQISAVYEGRVVARGTMVPVAGQREVIFRWKEAPMRSDRAGGASGRSGHPQLRRSAASSQRGPARRTKTGVRPATPKK